MNVLYFNFFKILIKLYVGGEQI